MYIKIFTCKEKARRAGMGMRAAIKNAIMLLIEVRATLVPVRRKQSPVLSFGKYTGMSQAERRGQDRTGEERRGEDATLKGMLVPVSVKE